MGELLSELGINLPSFIAQLVNFLILFGLLYLVAYKPVLKMLDERSNKVKSSLEQAEIIKAQAEKAQEDFKVQIAEASKQGQMVIERASKTGDEIREKAKAEAQAEAEALIARAKAEIRRERDEVIDELRKEFADLTILAAGKVIGKSLDKTAHREMINQVLEESAGLRKN
ncbi:F0F1 ATP synthase subunit B [Dehalogenimonas etheniformans]|uniref:ATP synthase subunit b n=1 Tax=Dehalogenimonas etheniformans TaxID=1536648 RepID=A0A2P5P9G1_9CHLR|nr:F0F1 ATP synthase subunit B [Dehalogenimonas etheniformans]PPD58936.1 ATP synthase F0 subunit B [Dehalogenimonas etheniformans]QNT76295.1 F0F1 ATP synthase subunit B [Dehalogenimonas etheniformans]